MGIRQGPRLLLLLPNPSISLLSFRPFKRCLSLPGPLPSSVKELERATGGNADKNCADAPDLADVVAFCVGTFTFDNRCSPKRSTVSQLTSNTELNSIFVVQTMSRISIFVN